MAKPFEKIGLHRPTRKARSAGSICPSHRWICARDFRGKPIGPRMQRAPINEPGSSSAIPHDIRPRLTQPVAETIFSGKPILL
jgi:hypothetical protein